VSANTTRHISRDPEGMAGTPQGVGELRWCLRGLMIAGTTWVHIMRVCMTGKARSRHRAWSELSKGTADGVPSSLHITSPPREPSTVFILRYSILTSTAVYIKSPSEYSSST